MMDEGFCRGDAHDWQEWRWAKVQLPVRGQPLQAVWVRGCANCTAREVRRTAANRRPSDGECQGSSAIITGSTTRFAS